MATITVTSSYVGDALKKYILACMLGGETLSTNGISVQTNVKYKRKIKKIGIGDVVQCGSCDFTPTSGVTITEAVLSPCESKINEEICFEDLYQLWDSADMAAGIHNENVPQSLADGLTEAYTKVAAQEIEKAIWQNDDTATGTTFCACFDGYECQLAAGGVTGGTGATLTVSNILTHLNAAYALVPACVLAKPKNELVIFMSHKAFSLYEMNLATQGVNTSIQAGVPTLYGIEIKPISGLSNDNIIVIGARDNFYIGTDLESDYNQIKVIDMRETTGDESVRYIMKWKMDVAIAYPGEVVYYNAV
jgi:hypothetical protein